MGVGGWSNCRLSSSLYWKSLFHLLTELYRADQIVSLAVQLIESLCFISWLNYISWWSHSAFLAVIKMAVDYCRFHVDKVSSAHVYLRLHDVSTIQSSFFIFLCRLFVCLIPSSWLSSLLLTSLLDLSSSSGFGCGFVNSMHNCFPACTL